MHVLYLYLFFLFAFYFIVLYGITRGFKRDLIGSSRISFHRLHTRTRISKTNREKVFN